MQKVKSPPLEIGKRYRRYISKNNPNNKTFHVLAIVDEDRYVIKWWTHSHGWQYAVECGCFFELNIKKGYLFISR